MKTTMKKLDHVTLAEGEVTGHSHRAVGGTLYDDGGVMVLAPGEETTITHEEHGTFSLPKTAKRFDVRKVQEIDHASDSVRNVAD